VKSGYARIITLKPIRMYGTRRYLKKLIYNTWTNNDNMYDAKFSKIILLYIINYNIITLII